MNVLNDRREKLERLVSALDENCDRRRSYWLTIVTCYFDTGSCRTLVEKIKRIFKHIDHIEIYLDRRTAISIGHQKLSYLETSHELEIKVNRGKYLFHTKGYLLTAWENDDDIADGCLIVGSANLTPAGLIKKYGNVESFVATTDLDNIQLFYNNLQEHNWVGLDELMSFQREDDNFRYALLQTGFFSHRFTADIARYFSLRYQLNEKGRQRAGEGIPVRGFQISAASISKAYFDFPLGDWHANDSQLIRNFGIECDLGHWIPKVAVNHKRDDDEFKKFKKALNRYLKSQMEMACEEAKRDYDSLLEEGIIDGENENDEIEDETEGARENPAVRLKRQIDDLTNEENETKLLQFFFNRSFFDFPYDVGESYWIVRIFDQLQEAASQARRSNKAKKGLLDAIKNVNPELINEIDVN